MPTPIGHSIGGVAAYIFGRKHLGHRSLVLLGLFWLAAVLPDIDYLPLLWGDLSLANHNHQWFTHSIFFSLISSLLLAIVGKWLLAGRISARSLFLPLLLAALSHLLFDYFTYDGRYPIGIPLLWPLEIRFNSPISIFGGVAKGSLSSILSLHNLLTIVREVLVTGVVLGLSWFFFAYRKSQASEREQEQR